MLFLMANGADVTRMGFEPGDVSDFPQNLSNSPLRLDPEELNHAKLLVSRHLEGLLHERYPECRCYFVGEAVDPRTFFPLGFRSQDVCLRLV